ncbi:MAG: alcohol dehydrogenase catalytic domain-containing protein [Candidatus Binatia bacterium]|nr:alcohol dehydrogenase catalytic domain-containing protein [Candidatus Binatia bacterium]
MKALVYHAPHDIRCDDVPNPDPGAVDGAIVRITHSGICGSDLHIYEGHGWGAPGHSTGHEAVGEVVEVGSNVRRFRTGDRVFISGAAACATCLPCAQGRMDLCDSGNASVFGIGIGLAGSQAEAVAVPGADNTLAIIPEGMTEEQALMLTDNLPTGWFGATRADIAPGSTVAVVGLGPVGQHAVESALVLGASRVLALDLVPERLAAAAAVGAEPVPVDADTVARVQELTGGRGVDASIEAVGRDDSIKLAMDIAGRGATISVVGVPDSPEVSFPALAVQGRNQTLRLSLCPVQSTWNALIPLVLEGRLHPERVITTRVPLTEGADAYARFHARQDGIMKVVLGA